jgi:TRAP-type C4-dicarboxylate transport system substrate-binding protein
MQSRILLAALTLAATLPVAPGPVFADTIQLTIISAQPPRMRSVGLLRDFFVPEVDKRLAAMGGKHRIKWTQGYAGSIAKGPEVLEAVQKGIADIAQVGILFEGAKLPLQQMTWYAPFHHGTLQTVVDVAQKLNDTMPELSAAYAKYNQVMLTAIGTDNYQLVTTFPVRSVDDIKGRKIGTPGTASNWLRGTGAVNVSAELINYYNSLKTGVFEGIIVFGSGIVPFKFYEVAPYITKVDFGPQNSTAITMNKRKWNRLPEDVRTVLKDVANEYRTRVAGVQEASGRRALSITAKRGAKVYTLPADERAKWANKMPNIAREWADRLEKKGLPAHKILNAYMEALRGAGARPLRDWDK